MGLWRALGIRDNPLYKTVGASLNDDALTLRQARAVIDYIGAFAFWAFVGLVNECGHGGASLLGQCLRNTNCWHFADRLTRRQFKKRQHRHFTAKAPPRS